jgi:N-methylhydantoinase A/oxoprolinase/acetone carboxylase beta subunit
MKVKFAAARLEFKEQITSLGTKMELTSQSLIRETQQKQKGAEFFEAEKRKFYQLIEAKDKEIQQIHDTMVRLKELNEEEITQQKSQLNMMRDSLAAKEQEFSDFKAALEEQYQRRSSKLIEEHAAQ